MTRPAPRDLARQIAYTFGRGPVAVAAPDATAVIAELRRLGMAGHCGAEAFAQARPRPRSDDGPAELPRVLAVALVSPPVQAPSDFLREARHHTSSGLFVSLPPRPWGLDRLGVLAAAYAAGWRTIAVAPASLGFRRLDALDTSWLTLLLERADAGSSVDVSASGALATAARGADADIAEALNVGRLTRPRDAAVLLADDPDLARVLHATTAVRVVLAAPVRESVRPPKPADSRLGPTEAGGAIVRHDRAEPLLASLGPRSVDLVAALGLPAARDARLAAEFAARVVRPAGRIIVSARAADADALAELARPIDGLLLEHVFAIGAGADPPSPRPRLFAGIAVDAPPPAHADRLMACWMVDPVGADASGFTEPAFDGDDRQPRGRVVDFASGMDNPWLFRAAIEQHMRSSRPALVEEIVARALTQARAGSADEGAMLTVRAYALLAAPHATSPEAAALVRRIARFAERADETPHGVRWRISALFAGARLAQALGDAARADELDLLCARSDPLAFSPLLATKTVAAFAEAGRRAYAAGRLDDARKHFASGLRACRRALAAEWEDVVGSMDDPLLFSLRELAMVADAGNMCAQGLRAVIDHAQRPGSGLHQIERYTIASQLREAAERAPSAMSPASPSAPIADQPGVRGAAALLARAVRDAVARRRGRKVNP